MTEVVPPQAGSTGCGARWSVDLVEAPVGHVPTVGVGEDQSLRASLGVLLKVLADLGEQVRRDADVGERLGCAHVDLTAGPGDSTADTDDLMRQVDVLAG